MPSRSSKTINQKRFYLPIALLVLALAAIIFTFTTSRPVTPQTRTEAWKKFQTLTASRQLPNDKPLYSANMTMGCFDDEPISAKLPDCTFSTVYYYAPAGDYRANGRRLYDFLKQQGYYFTDTPSQQKFENRLRDTAAAGNMSNVEPIVIELHHQDGTWLRLSLGSRARISPVGSGTVDSALSSITNDTLIGKLDFYQTLPK